MSAVILLTTQAVPAQWNQITITSLEEKTEKDASRPSVIFLKGLERTEETVEGTRY